jgi:predicted metal-binding protein
MSHVAHVCRSCVAGQAGLAAALATAMQGLAVEVREVDCMSGCTRASTVAFRATGKMAYLFGDLDLDDLPDLVTFARLYLATPDGVLADARPLGGLRMKALARIPG